jgi:hypothetical protein
VELFESAIEELTGKIDYRHVYLNFTDIEVELDSNKVVKTCPAALGPAFAAGTTDGPVVFGFQQGDTEVSVPILTFCTTNFPRILGAIWNYQFIRFFNIKGRLD